MLSQFILVFSRVQCKSLIRFAIKIIENKVTLRENLVIQRYQSNIRLIKVGTNRGSVKIVKVINFVKACR